MYIKNYAFYLKKFIQSSNKLYSNYAILVTHSIFM